MTIRLGTSVLLGFLFLYGCATSVDSPPATTLPPDGKADGAGVHYAAQHCEIFVDRIVAVNGSHALNNLRFYVKTLNGRLDAPIAAVGFRRREFDRSGAVVEDWKNASLTAFVGASDYFSIDLELSSDFSSQTYEGAFFVRTTNNTTYWLKPRWGDSENFLINGETQRVVRAAMNLQHDWDKNYDADPSAGTGTQNDALSYFNPDRCY